MIGKTMSHYKLLQKLGRCINLSVARLEPIRRSGGRVSSSTKGKNN